MESRLFPDACLSNVADHALQEPTPEASNQDTGSKAAAIAEAPRCQTPEPVPKTRILKGRSPHCMSQFVASAPAACSFDGE